ncbi:MAG: SOS response-associated peptidase [Pseudomonadota bacterium]
MAGRYMLTATAEELERAFAVRVDHAFPPRYNIAPSQPIAIVRVGFKRTPEFALVQWGLTPPWRSHGTDRLTPVARIEGVLGKPMFQSAFKRRRCLVPASGFYVWRGEQGARTPYLVRPKREGAFFAFAAIWEPIIDETGSEIDRAAILTTKAGRALQSVSEREPMVIPSNAFARWLETDERDLKLLRDLENPQQDGFWRTTRVSTAINDPTREGASLIEPIDG